MGRIPTLVRERHFEDGLTLPSAGGREATCSERQRDVRRELEEGSPPAVVVGEVARGVSRNQLSCALWPQPRESCPSVERVKEREGREVALSLNSLSAPLSRRRETTA
jgi:hypothetical protein